VTDTRFRPALSRTLAIGASALALAVSVPAYADEAGPDDIVVTAQRLNQTEVTRGGSAGALGDKPAEDLPFTIKSYNAALILNQQPQTLGQVLENDPSVRTTYGFGNASEQFVIRGFALFGDDVGIDGLYGIAPRQLIAPELYDSVQVINGASAFINGAAPGGSGLGGSVNLIPKRAGADPLTRVTANYTSTSHFGGSADVSRRFGPDGEWGLRVNGVARAGDVSVDDEYRSAYTLGAALDYNGGPLRFSVDLGYQNVTVRQLRHKVTGATSLPVVPAADANYAQPWTYTKLRDIFGVAKLEYDLSDNALIYVRAGARDGMEDGLYGGLALSDTATGAASYSASYVPRTDNNEAVQGGLRVKLAAGGITHEINFGGSMAWQVNRNAYDFLASQATNLYDPAVLPKPASLGGAFFTNPGGNLANPYPIQRNRLGSAFVSDTVGLWNDRVLLTGGLRLQTIDQKNYSYVDGALAGEYNEDAVTPAFGLVVKPLEGVSLYANYMEGFEAGPTAPTSVADATLPGGLRPVTNGGQALAPSRTKQVEFGGKVRLGPVNASLAFFQIDRPLPAAIIDPNNSAQALYGVFAQQRNRGIEFSIDGEVTKGLRVIAGGSVIDARLRRTDGGINEGNRAQGVPTYLLNANVEWDLPFVPGATLTGRVVHTGPQAADNANTFNLPAWTRVDLGARYVAVVADKPLTLRFGVDNAANKRYWASAFDSFGVGLLQGAPRTFKLSASIDM
jgi:iron complex outermembrane receptor protein